jgi:predicted RNase H-like HicB family nuclease
MQIHYPAVLARVEGGYGVRFPDVPGCVAFGRTQGEAAEKAAGALLARLELMAAEGRRAAEAVADRGRWSPRPARSGACWWPRARSPCSGSTSAWRARCWRGSTPPPAAPA